ncbi:CDP-alcohol phosphatidyltransferase family protein [Alteromonas sp. C1M14]|uniref:CDP-alcohol phosphatidyltransferase family protein n=1 Tax=Alteromonas sp. C1M14 TaxID=2841567 RepID=UPI001C0A56A1|nr:CDP-alcohol phosphatidyltransferase family protein [Alteromonas sp. C1M14]MBU2979776.1 CDP-alcohol phosphatidyltransferase family protein [Alteromonas sp. C1M14]
MIDAKITPLIKPLLRPVVAFFDKKGASPNHITVAGFVLGMLAVPAILLNAWGFALLFIGLNRVCDGLDGELARFQNSSSSAGGYLDICLDFLFYASIPLAFGIADPVNWGVPALTLLAAFIGTGSSFLAFAIAAEKYHIQRPQFASKSFYYMQGLTEGTETIVVFILFCLMPQWFPVLAYVFSAACLITIVTRIAGGFNTLVKVEKNG